MKVSYNWLKQYIKLDMEAERLSEVLTNIGLEVEGVSRFQSVKGGLKGILIGEVKTCASHPNADKLSITTVDVGKDELLPIVCGAPNVAKGQKVVVATVGTTLYAGDDSFEIKKAKIRGEVSEGMICAEDELGLGSSHDGIIVLPDNAKVGQAASDYFDIEEDIVFEIGLTPNRADATSQIGSARDLAAGLNQLSASNQFKLEMPDVGSFKVDNNSLDIDVVVEDTQACPRYTAVTLSGIAVKESPDWLKNRLLAIGVRPINNVVDVTNYVLHETGQPLHAFNADAINGNMVVVKKQPQNTPFVCLDEVERKLDQNDLMICSADTAMCIAGVFGGLHSGVDAQTTNIFLESAYFDATHIRKTSKRHALQTDASFRFERGADPNITVYALKRAILLLQEVAGGAVSSEIKDVYPQKIEPWTIQIDYKNVDRLIGKVIDRKTIKTILLNLAIEILEDQEDGLLLRVPTFKVDVKREADIIEEILRIYGYNNIEIGNKVNASVSIRQKPDLEKLQNGASDYMVALGYTETMNNSLSRSAYAATNEQYDEAHNVKLLNPLSQDLDAMRQTLLFGGLEVIAYNINRKTSRIRTFEFGKIYQFDGEAEGLKKYFEEKQLRIFSSGDKEAENWNKSTSKTDFYELKATVEGILRKVGLDRKKVVLKEVDNSNFTYNLQYYFNDILLVEMGQLSNKLLKDFGINQDVYTASVYWERIVKRLSSKDIHYQPVSKFPTVRRDLSILIDQSIGFESLRKVAAKTEKKLLKSVGIFDIYQGDKIPADKKSYALSFLLQDEEKTLTDKVIDKAMKKIQMTLEREFEAQLR